MKQKPVRCPVAAKLFIPEQLPCVMEYLSRVQQRLHLSRKYTHQMLEDHACALHRLMSRGETMENAMTRLNPERLGDFYLKERTDWYPLDVAAKIYPLSMSVKRMMVFRLSCYLKEPVVPEILQMALTYVMRRFPSFATTIKCGFFWHYLDSGMRRYAVRPETKLPCAVMKVVLNVDGDICFGVNHSLFTGFGVVAEENELSIIGSGGKLGGCTAKQADGMDLISRGDSTRLRNDMILNDNLKNNVLGGPAGIGIEKGSYSVRKVDVDFLGVVNADGAASLGSLHLIAGIVTGNGFHVFTINGQTFENVKIFAVEALPSLPGKTEGKLFIPCREGAVRILELQIPGKKRMDTRSFLNGLH